MLRIINQYENRADFSEREFGLLLLLLLGDWLCYFVEKEKRGRCPVVMNGTAGTCDEECTNDINCSGVLKCCSNGCGHTCRQPGMLMPNHNPFNSITCCSVVGLWYRRTFFCQISTCIQWWQNWLRSSPLNRMIESVIGSRQSTQH